MRFKLDECIDVRLTKLFKYADLDAETVYDEKLGGTDDKILYDICLKEKRTLITQDLDFSNPFVFDPLPTNGIVVLRNPSQLLHDLEGLVAEMISLLSKESPAGRLPNQNMLTTHPQRWHDRPWPWLNELVSQTIKNTAKTILITLNHRRYPKQL